jgi:hypothetical protein
VFAHIGFGDAVCDKDKPTSDCPVEGAFTAGLGGAWRFHPHWAAGLEIALWSFGVRDEWKGQLTDAATDVSVRSLYVTPFVRWYWFDHDSADPYLHFGIGYGSLQVEASNDLASYEVRSGGVAVPLGIGVEWHVSDLFRLGPQALSFLLLSSTICETENGTESCRDPGSAVGTRQDEGNALPWRLSLVGTFMFGS